ncbi:MAG: T9SS type A sorting domain-containing protein, partial [Solirubrobacterales bacterium]
PTAGQCATAASMSIVVNALPIATAATWNGSVSGSWFTAANWTTTPGGAVLGATTAITIPGGVLPNYCTLNAPATCASIMINDGGSFIGAEFLTVGTASVKRDITNTKYHYLSSPVATATFGNVFANSLTTWAKKWNPLTNAWVWQTSLNTFGVGAGYAVTTTTPTITANFTGSLNAAPVTSTLSNANGGWNLLGNPFQSAIDWDNVVKGPGVAAAVSVWTGVNYITWNGSVGGLTGGIIPAENGFFAITTVNNDFVTIPLAARVHSAVPFYKESVNNVLELVANGNNESDQTFVHFNNDATPAYDNQFDARKLFGEDYAPQLYSMISNDVLAINELPLAGNETIDLGFKCNANGAYSLTASGMESFDASTPIWLEDTKLNATQDLRANAVYNFSYAAGENANRFKLHFKSANGISDLSNSGISVYSYDHNVMISNTTSLAGEVWVYDMTGRELIHTNLNSQMTTSIPMQAAIGTYMVKVVTAKASVNHKVFIR